MSAFEVFWCKGMQFEMFPPTEDVKYREKKSTMISMKNIGTK